MKDATPGAYSGGLPQCSLSAHCARLLDELDEDKATLQDDPMLFEDDAQDRQLLAQLRVHIVDCPTCTTTLTRERAIRSQQHQVLRQLLTEGEQKIPSTAARIMLTISR
jgi:DNA repair exonuclease SbcCD ATPase subunit